MSDTPGPLGYLPALDKSELFAVDLTKPFGEFEMGGAPPRIRRVAELARKVLLAWSEDHKKENGHYLNESAFCTIYNVGARLFAIAETRPEISDSVRAELVAVVMSIGAALLATKNPYE